MNVIDERQIPGSAQNILDAIVDGVCVLDEEGKIKFTNPAATDILGQEPGELIGCSLHSCFHHSQPSGSSYPWEACPVYSTIENGEVQRVEGELFWKGEDSEIPVEYTAAPIGDHGGSDARGAVVVFRDISERREVESRLEYYSTHDYLTGLFNRHAFEQELEHQQARVERYGGTGALLWLDIDRFKEINDTYGHRFGDELLVSISDLLRDNVREADFLARFGGDEFVILLPRTSPDRVSAAARRILSEIRCRQLVIRDRTIQVTASMGVTLFPEHGTKTKKLLTQADMAMYKAKEEGRNRYRFFKPGEDYQEELESRVEWVRRIRRALREDSFVLYAQPILDVASREVSRYEVLIRLKDEGEIISPGAFLHVAERFGLSNDIDRWVVKRTLKLLSEASVGGWDSQLAINLSAQSLTDPSLLAWIDKESDLATIGSGKLLFEITETVALSNLNQANEFIDTLRTRGCKFALDDFGMGFSSFNYLRHLAVDYLKIDGSFIQNLVHDTMSQHLVQAMVEVAHRMDKETVAEFVEDEETLDLVEDYGADYAQGYYISRPCPISEILS